MYFEGLPDVRVSALVMSFNILYGSMYFEGGWFGKALLAVRVSISSTDRCILKVEEAKRAIQTFFLFQYPLRIDVF